MKFPNLDSFFSKAKDIEKSQIKRAIDDASAKSMQILNSTSVQLSVMNNPNCDTNEINNIVQESINKSIETLKFTIDTIFEDHKIMKDKEQYYIDKLAKLFNIDLNRPINDIKAEIDRHLNTNDDMLAYIDYILSIQ